MRVLRVLTVVLVFACGKKEIGEPCNEPGECKDEVCLDAEGSLSNRQVCTKHCDGDGDCPDAGRCIGGTCEATCSSQGDCPSENVCQEGVCRVECRSQDDCVNATCPAAGQVCEQ